MPGALATGALVVEDLKPQDFDERALFHLMNLAREDGAYVLITGASRPPRSRSNCAICGRGCARCRWCRCCRPTTSCFARLIVKFCADRQLAVDESVVSYLATRIERSYAAARQAVELLDTRGPAAGPAGDPGAGGRIAAQCLNATVPA